MHLAIDHYQSWALEPPQLKLKAARGQLQVEFEPIGRHALTMIVLFTHSITSQSCSLGNLSAVFPHTWGRRGLCTWTTRGCLLRKGSIIFFFAAWIGSRSGGSAFSWGITGNPSCVGFGSGWSFTRWFIRHPPASDCTLLISYWTRPAYNLIYLLTSNVEFVLAEDDLGLFLKDFELFLLFLDAWVKPFLNQAFLLLHLLYQLLLDLLLLAQPVDVPFVCLIQHLIQFLFRLQDLL